MYSFALQNRKNFFTSLIVCLFIPFSQAQNSSTSPAGATVYFVSPAQGERVTSPVTVRFGLAEMGVAPAGIPIKNTGHHHLLINVPDVPNLSEPLPSTENIKHFGLGQTQTELDLPRGAHTLRLVLGDHLHIPHSPPVMSETLTITVE
jgi:hypothetical protein